MRVYMRVTGPAWKLRYDAGRYGTGFHLRVTPLVGSMYLAEEVNDCNIGYASAHPSKFCQYRCFADVAKYLPDTMSDPIIG